MWPGGLRSCPDFSNLWIVVIPPSLLEGGCGVHLSEVILFNRTSTLYLAYGVVFYYIDWEIET